MGLRLTYVVEHPKIDSDIIIAAILIFILFPLLIHEETLKAVSSVLHLIKLNPVNIQFEIAKLLVGNQ